LLLLKILFKMTSNTEDIVNKITNNEASTDEQCKRATSIAQNI
jgi:hypothetical protein